MPEIEQVEDEIKPNFVKRQKLQRIQKIQVAAEFSQTSPQRWASSNGAGKDFRR